MGTVKRLMWFALSDECLKANVWVLSARADEGKEDTSFRTGPEHEPRHELQDRYRTVSQAEVSQNEDRVMQRARAGLEGARGRTE
jgi:hypothetical protein